MLKVILLVTLLVVGCKTLTPEEQEWRQGIDKENLGLCLGLYKRKGEPWYSTHSHGEHDKHRPSEIREDLMVNQCRLALGKEYINY